jgi:hypothetical protein
MRGSIYDPVPVRTALKQLLSTALAGDVGEPGARPRYQVSSGGTTTCTQGGESRHSRFNPRVDRA